MDALSSVSVPMALEPLVAKGESAPEAETVVTAAALPTTIEPSIEINPKPSNPDEGIEHPRTARAAEKAAAEKKALQLKNRQWRALVLALVLIALLLLLALVYTLLRSHG
jgi:hypothetical protein